MYSERRIYDRKTTSACSDSCRVREFRPRKNDFSLTSKAETFLAIVQLREPASSRVRSRSNRAVNISRYASGEKKKKIKKKRKRRTSHCAPLKLRPFFRVTPSTSSLFVVCPFSFLRRPFYRKVSAPFSRRERFVFNGREK